MTAADAADGTESPARLRATTMNVYDVRLLRPVIVHDVAGAAPSVVSVTQADEAAPTTEAV